MNTTEAMNQYYSQYNEDGRLRSRHGMVEYLTTMRYIERYLKPGMRIMEIGAGTGRYSHALAQQGYQVDAVELVQHNIDVFQANTMPGERVTVTQGNALNLSAFADETYDITLLLGPMYHLFTSEEQIQALSEAIRVTKTGGLVYAAYCSNDATMIQACFQRGFIRDPHFQPLIDPVTFQCTSTPAELFQLYRKEDVDALMEIFCVQRLHYVGSDMAAHYIRGAIDEMDDELFETYMRYHFVICERADMVGMSNHMLDIFRKK